MQKKKIFIEVQLPGQVKKRLSRKIEQWAELPVKWSKEENFHLAISFVGYVDESMLPEICAKVSSATESVEAFDLQLDNIKFSPNELDPQTVVLTGQSSEELGALHCAIQQALGMKTQQYKHFRPVITLGKIRSQQWEELAEKPIINEKVSVVVPIDFVSVMESKGGGAEYFSLEDCPLS